MAFKISIPTFEQLSTMMSHLMTNYTSLATSFYKMFFDATPQDVDLKLYDSAGDLKEYKIPNRAKDFTYILNGEGSPENVVSANVGSIYQDTLNGDLYVKQFDTGVSGWVWIDPKKSIEKGYVSGDNGPNGYLIREKGALYEDIARAVLYIKTTETGNDGWIPLNASTDLLANIDLSNLSVIGNNKFANPSLNNLSQAGEDRFDAKQDVSNIVQVIENENEVTYPSEAAVKAFVEEKENKIYSELANRANIDLANLSEAGEARLNKLIPYVITSGNTDVNKQLDILDATNGTSNVLFSRKFENAGDSYSFTLTTAGVYNLTMVGGGGAMGGTYNYYDPLTRLNFNVYNNGAAGASFDGTIYLTAGTYTVTVGDRGNITSSVTNVYAVGGPGGYTELKKGDDLIIRTGGGSGGSRNPYTTTTGGVLEFGSGIVEVSTPSSYGQYTKVANRTGNGQNGPTGYNNYLIGTAKSPYSEQTGTSYGQGAAWGYPNSAAARAGYFAIGSGSIVETVGERARMNYNIADDKPLNIVTLEGYKREVTAINPDYVGTGGLGETGTYFKFIDEEGSDLFMNIKIIASAYAPTSNLTVNDIWIKRAEPLEVYKWSGSAWEPYKKLYLASYDYNATTRVLSNFHTARLYDNGFNVTQWQGVVVEHYANSDSWMRRYSDDWCEQGGKISSGSSLTFVKSFKDTSYVITTSGNISGITKSASGFSYSGTGDWIAMGYVVGSFEGEG